jgi:hypothetical protein
MQSWVLRRGARLTDLLTWSLQMHSVDRLLVTARLTHDKKQQSLMKPSVEKAVDSIFGSRILEKKLVSRWPGTKLIGHQGVVYVIAFDDSLIRPMAAAGRLLFDWVHRHDPPLPEDICLFRQGADWPALVSVTHELDGWVFSEEAPAFCKKKPTDFNQVDFMVPDSSDNFTGD